MRCKHSEEKIQSGDYETYFEKISRKEKNG